MAELRFLGLSQDGSQVLLADSRGRKHSVTVDARLLAAMRLDGHTTGQREIALNTTFSPRQIQARLRSGATVADLADEYGVPVEKVERFSGPPLADRAFTADQARRTVLTSHLGDRPLDVVVASAAEATGIAPESIRWDAWLREDGLWQVLSSYPSGNLDQVATWVFDPREATVAADDDTARGLLGGPPEGRSRMTAVPAEAAPPPTEPTLSDGEQSASRTSRSADTRSTDTRSADARSGDSGSASAESAATEPAAAETVDARGADSAELPETERKAEPTRQAKRGRRASVPTWDEILFGSQAHDDDPAT